jgi:hypothetical protein
MELTAEDIRLLRQQGDLGQTLRELVKQAAAADQSRKALVLRHEDLAERLTRPPIGFARPDCWTGYLAPELLPSGDRNTSPIRAALVAIVAEAERRQAAHNAPQGNRGAAA